MSWKWLVIFVPVCAKSGRIFLGYFADNPDLGFNFLFIQNIQLQKKLGILIAISKVNRICRSQFQNVPFWPISALGENIYPRNTPCIPAVKIFIRLDLDQTETF